MQHPYDNYTEMFDAYLNGSMTPADRQELDERLATDAALAGELRLHRLTVAAVRHQAAATNERRGEALQGIGRDQLEQLLAAKRAKRPERVTPPPFKMPKKKKKGVIARLLPWAAAAVVVGIVGMVGLMGVRMMWHHGGTSSPQVAQVAPKKTATQPLANANAEATVVAQSDSLPYYLLELDFAKTSIKNGNAEAAIKVLKRLYEQENIKEAAPLLAEAYLKLGETNNAMQLAQDFGQRYPGDDSLLKQLEQLEKAD